MTEHLDLDALADVLAGEPSAHLETCDQCRAEVAALQAAMTPVAAGLAGLPDPEPPPGLEERVTAALARERRLPAKGETVIPLASRRRPGRWLPLSAGVAAAAALVGGGIVITQHGSPRSVSDKSAAGYRTNSTGADYRKDGALLARALPSLLTGAASTPELQAGTRPGVAAQTAAPGNVAPPRAQAADALAALRTTAGLAACLASLSDAQDSGLPLALDYASFEGQPALVVVLPAAKPDKVDVFVVGAGCSQADAKVLFFARLPKPA